MNSARCRVSIVALVLALSVVPRAQTPASGLLIGVARGSVLQPVARFDGTGWAVAVSPPSWPRAWWLWSSGAAASSRVTAVVSTAASCTAPRTMTIEPLPDGARGQRFQVAASAPAPLSLVHSVARGSREWNAASAALPSLFEKRATQSGISPLVLARVPATIDAMSASDSGPPLYYLEASKRIGDAGGTPLEDPKGVLRVSLSGWFRADGQRLVPAATKAELHWEAADDRRPVAPALAPIALMRQPGRDVWLMVATLGDRTSYALYAVTASTVRVLVTVDAAQC